MKELQNKLDELYLEYLNKILKDEVITNAIENGKLSSPLFIDVSAPQGNYVDRPYKVLYVGQETNSWFNEKERKEKSLLRINDASIYLTALKDLYKKFNIGEKYNTPIFLFLDILISEIQSKQGSEDKTGFLWTNLIRHSAAYNEGKPSKDIIQKVMYDNNYILRQEINILNPNAIIFVTGPNYDEFLKNTYPKLEIKQVKRYGIDEIASLHHPELKAKSIRVYHPGYHRNLGGTEYMKELSQDIWNYINT